jgi:signal transduction protein with GAF and PtsI domain
VIKPGKKKRASGVGNTHEHQKLTSLWSISQSLYQYVNVNDLILHIIERISRVMNAEAVSVILCDRESNELVFCWSSEEPERTERLREIRLPDDQGIAGSVFKSGKAEIISDVEKDSRHYRRVDDATKFSTKSMIAVPLKTKVETIGVLEVLNKKKGLFDHKDLSFLTTLAPIIAMALDSAKLCTELNTAYKELQAIDKSKDELIDKTENEVALLRQRVEKRYRFD